MKETIQNISSNIVQFIKPFKATDKHTSKLRAKLGLCPCMQHDACLSEDRAKPVIRDCPNHETCKAFSEAFFIQDEILGNYKEYDTLSVDQLKKVTGQLIPFRKKS